jgi:hypothetical protein
MSFPSPETTELPQLNNWLREDLNNRPQPVETTIKPDGPFEVGFDTEKILVEPLPDHFYNRYQLLRKVVNNGIDDMAELVEERSSFEEVLDSFNKIHTVTKSWGEYTRSPSEKNLSGAIRHDVIKRIGNIITSLEGTAFDPEMRNAYLDIAKAESTTVKPAVKSWARVLTVLRGEDAETTKLNKDLRLIREIINLVISTQEDRRVLDQIDIPGGFLPVIALNLKSNSDLIAEERGLIPSLKCSIGAKEENGQAQLVFRAWDEAGGFDEAMFDNGQLKIGKTKRAGGTGVGFQTINSFLESMGGTATVGNWLNPETGETKGAYFEFHIPLKKTRV